MWLLSPRFCLGKEQRMFLPILCGCLSAATKLEPSESGRLTRGFSLSLFSPYLQIRNRDSMVKLGGP